ncbi:deacetylase complex subunit protein [Rutstroemia sp. NJR-2017a BBW]|nr:deacetylase complex subunit protein [Rutstroemia sp. NJR-2017a BBW]PQE08711.1 deacetylase complex subunit protein [Rutstroemia sp. NJR-2017a BBW]
MAMSPSPQMSPTLGGRIDRQRSNSPPPHQQSKRDKRRSMLQDRLAEMHSSFAANRDLHYRDQLQGLQIDMNLIQEADVHGKLPLPDGKDVSPLVQDAIRKVKAIAGHTPTRAGREYEAFAREINNAMEERDVALTTHMRDYEVKANELESNHAYRMRLADLEYKALMSTLRDRLINSVVSKKARLAKDKDMIEVGESNALLLHPSQFGLANPASPGGMHSKRATRHRREAEEVPSYLENTKRKRKGLEGDESPAPSRQRLDNGGGTPIWFSERNHNTSAQIDASLYSIDKLFTEKELAMTYNQAALAAHTYMVRHAPYADDNSTPQNGRSDSSSDTDKPMTGTGEVGDEDEDSPLSAPTMERQPSHVTRSTRGAANFNTGTGIDTLSDLSYPGNMAAITKQMPRLPPLLAGSMQKGYVKGESANQPQGLSQEEINAELEIIRRGRTYNDERGYGKNLELENGGRTLLEAVMVPRKAVTYYVKSDNKASMLSSMREEMGGEPMSKQSSRGGSDAGGTPMSRQGTNEGSRANRGRKNLPA